LSQTTHSSNILTEEYIGIVHQSFGLQALVSIYLYHNKKPKGKQDKTQPLALSIGCCGRKCSLQLLKKKSAE